MRLLVDECLPTRLAAVAHGLGHEAYHVAHIGWAGLPDWALMERIKQGDYTLVTNNAVDFLQLYEQQAGHAGLILLLTQLPGSEQRDVFQQVLAGLEGVELRNRVVEVMATGQDLHISEYPFP